MPEVLLERGAPKQAGRGFRLIGGTLEGVSLSQDREESLLQEYLQVLRSERNRSPYTLRNYARDLRPYFAFLTEAGSDLVSADRHTIRAYLASLADAGFAPASVTRKVSTIRTFYRYLLQAGHIAANPCAAVRGPKRPRRLPGFLDEEEVTALLESQDSERPQGLRNRALLELLYAAGVRVSEAVGLDTSDLRAGEEGGMLRVRGKGNKERIVLVGRPAARALFRYLRRGRPYLAKGAEEALFLNRGGDRLSVRAVQIIVRKAALACGLDKRAHPHLIRHTFATHMLDGGADLRVVQELMGHASANTTQIYLHVTEARQRQVYDRAWDAMAESYERLLQERKKARIQGEEERQADEDPAY
jgi:tyrosine recombinase XerC